MLNKFIPKSVKKYIKLKLHQGDKYICPFCNYKSKDFYPIGDDFKVNVEKQIVGAGRRNAGCFNCGSTDRERLIYLYLRDVVSLFNQKELSILHLAPEKNLSQTILEHGFKEYVCGDLFTEGYSYPEHVVNMNVLNIPYGENHFDLVICNHLLEHVENDSEAMSQILRVLKPGGKAILQVPISKILEYTFEDFTINTNAEREQHFGQFNHVRIYGQDYLKRLENVSFQVERVNISEKYQQNGVNIDEDIFIAHKN
jgi:SAM-dependent methyltransferase